MKCTTTSPVKTDSTLLLILAQHDTIMCIEGNRSAFISTSMCQKVILTTQYYQKNSNDE